MKTFWSILIYLVVSKFNFSFGQFVSTGNNVPLLTTEQYVTNSPTSSNPNRKNVVFYKDSTYYRTAYPTFTFMRFTNSRNDGQPTSIFWGNNSGDLQRSPISSLRLPVSQVDGMSGTGQRVAAFNSNGTWAALPLDGFNYTGENGIEVNNLTHKIDIDPAFWQAFMADETAHFNDKADKSTTVTIDGNSHDLSTNSNFTSFPAWTNISGKPSFFSGNYNDLTNKPSLFSCE